MSVAPAMTDDPFDRLDRDVERAAEGRVGHPYDWDASMEREARRDVLRRHKRRRQSLVFALLAFLAVHAAIWTNSWTDSHRLDLVAALWAVAFGALAIYLYPGRE
jgi:hypothetical protein